MISDEDIKKLSTVFMTKEDLSGLKSDIQEVREDLDSKFVVLKSDIQEVKKDVESLRESLQGLHIAVDNLAKVILDLRLEYAVIKNQLNRHEEWIKKIAEKSGVSLAI